MFKPPAWLLAPARSCPARRRARPARARDHTGPGCPSRTPATCRNIWRAAARCRRSPQFARWPAARSGCVARPARRKGSSGEGIPRAGPRRDEQGRVFWPWRYALTHSEACRLRDSSITVIASCARSDPWQRDYGTRRSVGANQGNGAGQRRVDGRQESCRQRLEIGKPVRFRLQYDDGDREGTQVLLKGQVPIHRNEHVKTFRGKRQHFAVLDRRTTHLTGHFDVMTEDVTRQAPVDAFVEQDLHDAASITRSFASSRKAMTCSRVTEGNPWRKSSIDSPASR